MKFSSCVVDAPQCPKTPRHLVIRVNDLELGAVIQLSGEANFVVADRLKDALIPLVAKRTQLAVFDLSDLDFIASLAIGAMLNFRHEIAKWGGQVRIAGASPYIYDAFQSTNLTTLFSFYSTVEDALRF